MAWWNKGQGNLDPTTGLKICSSCKTPKFADNFYRHKNESDGLAGRCKECMAKNRDPEKARVAAAKWRASNPEEAKAAARASMRRWREANPETALLRAAGYRAKQQNIPCTITEDDIYIPERCPIKTCDRLLVIGDGKNKAASPSLDKYNPSLGYTKGNVWVICQACNSRKSNMTGEDFIVYGINLIDSFKEEYERVAKLSSSE